MLTVDSTNLNVVLTSDSLEFSHSSTKLRQSNVDRSSQGRAKIGGARCDVSKVIIARERGNLLDLVRSSSKSAEDTSDVSTLLH